MGELLRAQALVERLRPVAVVFQEATLRSKAESKSQLDAGGEIKAFVRQHAAHARNRDASLRLLKGLRGLMDVMLGAELPSDDDSWSDSDDDDRRRDADDGDVQGGGAEAAARARVAARLRAIEQQSTLLESRAQKLQASAGGAGAGPTAATGRAPTAESRDALLRDEGVALVAAASDPPEGSSGARLRALAVLVDALRAEEGSFEFQQTLMQAHQRLGTTTEYSRDNFAYGSTPWQSWLTVHTDPGCTALAAAVARCAEPGSGLPEYVVFGSSLGWLCFYAALTYAVPAVGYEIVEPLVEAAERLRATHCSGSGDEACSIAFHCQDMLQAPLDRCGVLLLTSRCWDKPLAQALHRRLIRDLPAATVVVDYSDDLAKAEGEGEGFEVAGSCVVPVSWDSQQKMHCMVRKAR